MTHPITLDMPDELYQPLVELAKEKGQTVEKVAKACLADSLATAPGARLRKWRGATASNLPDASVRHDDYLGQAILDQMQGKADD